MIWPIWYPLLIQKPCLKQCSLSLCSALWLEGEQWQTKHSLHIKHAHLTAQQLLSRYCVLFDLGVYALLWWHKTELSRPLTFRYVLKMIITCLGKGIYSMNGEQFWCNVGIDAEFECVSCLSCGWKVMFLSDIAIAQIKAQWQNLCPDYYYSL